jgi:hypothetical protein
MTKIAGSGSGSISQRHGSEDPDPDPHQNVMDPQHCEKQSKRRDEKVTLFYTRGLGIVVLQVMAHHCLNHTGFPFKNMYGNFHTVHYSSSLPNG